MKCCDDGLVNRGAVRLKKRPQEELVSHLLNSCMQPLQLQTLPLTCFRANAQYNASSMNRWDFRRGKMRGVMSQSVWGLEPPDYLAPQVMPETVSQRQ